MSDTDRSTSGDRARHASHGARRWMASGLPEQMQTSPLLRLGITLCERLDHARLPPVGSSLPPVTPDPSSLVEMRRADLIVFCRDLAIAPPASIHIPSGTMRRFRSCFGALALSYAAESDVLVVAVLLRASARAGMRHPWLDEAEMYLLDQQEPDGSFGRVAPESGLPGADADPEEIRLLLTVEILWALAERVSLRRRAQVPVRA